jgi:hypothetical protein
MVYLYFQSYHINKINATHPKYTKQRTDATVLGRVKAAARRLRRWPSASLDPTCAAVKVWTCRGEWRPAYQSPPCGQSNDGHLLFR